MTINIEEYPCEICGKPAKHILFAAFVCDNEDCIEQARINRGGPGGHMKRKAQGLPIIPEGLEIEPEEKKE